MPVYNAGAPLQRAIKSVVNQTYQDWKLWIIDDASTDLETRSILDIYMEVLDHPQITVLKKFKNSGPSNARNTAITFIELDSIIAYCDADDFWYPTHLERNIKLISEDRFDLVYSNPDLRNPEGHVMYPIFNLYESFDAENLKRGNFIFTPSVIHKNGLGFFDRSLDGLEDYDYWIRAFKSGYRIYQNPITTCCCTVRESGNNNMSSKGQSVLSKVREKHKDFFESENKS